MRAVSPLSFGLLLVAAAPAAAEPLPSRSFAVSGFTRLKVEGPYTVRVHTGGQPAARARGPRQPLDRLVVEVRGDTLVVTTRRSASFWRGGNGGKVEVDVSVPTLTAASLAGSGDVDVDRVRAPAFAASVAGSGNLTVARLDTPRLTAEVAGSGNLLVRGEADRADAELTGSGNLQGAGLSVGALNAAVTGSGDLVVGPTRTARAALTGSGNIQIGGRPKCTESRTGSGTIRCGDRR